MILESGKYGMAGSVSNPSRSMGRSLLRTMLWGLPNLHSPKQVHTISLCHNVRLHITVIVLASPHKTTTRLECLCHHVINKPMLVPDLGSLKLFPVVSAYKWALSISVASVMQKLYITTSTIHSFLGWLITFHGGHDLFEGQKIFLSLTLLTSQIMKPTGNMWFQWLPLADGVNEHFKNRDSVMQFLTSSYMCTFCSKLQAIANKLQTDRWRGQNVVIYFNNKHV
jgi:hypothetical protein